MAEPQSAIQDVVDVTIELQEELRELLSYCRTKADGPTVDGIWGHNEVYDEIAKKLAEILDGEGPCPHENANTEPNRNGSMVCRDCGQAL